MMNLHMKLGLLLSLATYTVADAPFYVPRVTIKPFLGRLTNLGFTLDQPQCIFHPYNTSDVWLVVALDTVVPNLTDTHLSNPVSFNSTKDNQYYHIYQMLGINFPCSDTAPSLSALVPVGVEQNCTGLTFCNGVLTQRGPYRVKFVVLNNNTMVGGTRWSEQINLTTGKNSTSLGQSSARSAGMIVIIVILSILLAILLACLIAALATGSKDIFWCRVLDNEGFRGREEVHMNEYLSNMPYIPHSIYKTHSKALSARVTKVYTVNK